MLINTLKLKNKRKSRKVIGRGGKKGTYCGRGCKGQKSRSGAHLDPLFEGGRSTLVDHMKKKKGFKSKKTKPATVTLAELEKKFKSGDIVNKESLIKLELIDKISARGGVKILGGGEIGKKLTVAGEIQLSSGAKQAIEKAGGKIEAK